MCACSPTPLVRWCNRNSSLKFLQTTLKTDRHMLDMHTADCAKAIMLVQRSVRNTSPVVTFVERHLTIVIARERKEMCSSSWGNCLNNYFRLCNPKPDVAARKLHAQRRIHCGEHKFCWIMKWNFPVLLECLLLWFTLCEHKIILTCWSDRIFCFLGGSEYSDHYNMLRWGVKVDKVWFLNKVDLLILQY